MQKRQILTCFGCKQKFRTEELVAHASVRAQTFHNYCPKCLKEVQDRELFSETICKIFGIKTPGPRIWTERKWLRDTYGYTDQAIVDCLEYIYNVEHKKKLQDTLFLVTPVMMDKMRQYKNNQMREANQLARAMTTEQREYVAPVQENKKNFKTTYNPDEWLEDD